MAKERGRGMGSAAIFGIAVLLNLILTVLLLDQVSRTRKEVDGLKSELASKQDIAMLRPIRVSEILEERCENCHTKRRFAATWGRDPNEVLAIIQRMRSHPGGEAIPGEEVPRINAALILFRCTSCHEEAVLSRLVLMPREERVRFIRKKVAMPGSGFRSDQVGDVIQAFELLAGEHL
jgi:hypothetical protein